MLAIALKHSPLSTLSTLESIPVILVAIGSNVNVVLALPQTEALSYIV